MRRGAGNARTQPEWGRHRTTRGRQIDGIDAVRWRVGVHPGEVKRKQAKSAIGTKRRLLWRSGMFGVVGRSDVIGTMPERRD